MSLKENKAIARRFTEEGWPNPDIFDEIVADDFVWHGTNVTTLEDFKKLAFGFMSIFPDMRTTAEDVIAEGDKVTVRWTFTGTQTGEWAGILPTNKQATWAGVAIYRIADGKVVEGWQWANMMGAFRQLGVLPPWNEMVEQANSRLG